MGVQFLSDEWMASATETLAAHEGFSGAIDGVDLSIQFVVTDAPAGEVNYHLDIADGSSTMESGSKDDADVTVTNDYETAAAIAKGELNTQMAFMTGKLKVAGNMAKLMMHQNVINQFADAAAGMDVDF